jgi:hypothetical protein
MVGFYFLGFSKEFKTGFSVGFAECIYEMLFYVVGG